MLMQQARKEGGVCEKAISLNFSRRADLRLCDDRLSLSILNYLQFSSKKLVQVNSLAIEYDCRKNKFAKTREKNRWRTAQDLHTVLADETWNLDTESNKAR
jgi:hypothetical protein